MSGARLSRCPQMRLIVACLRVLERARDDSELLDFDRLMAFGIRLRRTAGPHMDDDICNNGLGKPRSYRAITRGCGGLS